MPFMPEVMWKGGILVRLDKVLSDVKQRQAVLKDLRKLGAKPSAAKLAALGRTYKVFRNAAEERHFRIDWLTKWWPAAQPVAPVLRAGVMRAILVASGGAPRKGQPELPIDSYWVCHTGHGPGQRKAKYKAKPYDEHLPVEVGIAWSAQQVTLIFHTDEPPVEGPLTRRMPILIVKRVNKRLKAVRP